MMTIRRSSRKDAEIAIAMGRTVFFFFIGDSQRLTVMHRIGLLLILKFYHNRCVRIGGGWHPYQIYALSKLYRTIYTFDQ